MTTNVAILLLSRKDEVHVFLSMEFESFYVDPTQGEVNHTDGQVPKPSVLDDHLGVSNTSMDVDPSTNEEIYSNTNEEIYASLTHWVTQSLFIMNR